MSGPRTPVQAAGLATPTPSLPTLQTTKTREQPAPSTPIQDADLGTPLSPPRPLFRQQGLVKGSATPVQAKGFETPHPLPAYSPDHADHKDVHTSTQKHFSLYHIHLGRPDITLISLR